MAEWLKATDCKSVLLRVRRFEPYSAHIDRRSFSVGGLLILRQINIDLEKGYKFLEIKKSTFAEAAVDVSGSSSIGRAIAFQAIGREFDPRLPLRTVCGLWSVVCGSNYKPQTTDHKLS